MKIKTQLFFMIGFVVFLIAMGISVSFAYIGYGNVVGQTNVSGSITNTKITPGVPSPVNISMSIALSDLLSNKANNSTVAKTNTVNTSFNLTSSSDLSKGATCNYTITYVASTKFTPSHSTLKELTLSGKLNGSAAFTNTTLANVTSTTLYTGTIATSNSTTVTQNWTFTLNFFNINADQSALIGQNPKGVIKFNLGTCEVNS